MSGSLLSECGAGWYPAADCQPANFARIGNRRAGLPTCPTFRALADGLRVLGSEVKRVELHGYEIVFAPLSAHKSRFGVRIHFFQNVRDLVRQNMPQDASRESKCSSKIGSRRS